MTSLRDRIIAMFLGIAIGDALGMPVETMTGEEIKKLYQRIITYLNPAKTHKWYGGKLTAGMWTDDTQLSLINTKSLIDFRGIHLDDIADKLVKAMKDCSIGWGKSTIESATRLESGIHWSESGNPGGAGNGIAIKIAPYGAYLVAITNILFKQIKPLEYYEYATTLAAKFYHDVISIALMTHYSRLGIASGMSQAMAIRHCLVTKKFNAENFLDEVTPLSIDEDGIQIVDDNPDRLYERMEFVSVNLEKLKAMTPVELANTFGGATCYVYNSLPFSLACFLRNPHSIETLYDAINAGGDTDSNGSMVGALLGALNGTSIFPQHLIDGLWRKDEIIKIANDFCDAFDVE